MIQRKRRLLPAVLSVGLVAVLMLQVTPSQAAGGVAGTDTGAFRGGTGHAGTLGTGGFAAGAPAVDTSGCGDALDTNANQSRLAQIYQSKSSATYTGVLDIGKYWFRAGQKLDGTADPGFLNAAMQLCAPAPTSLATFPTTAGYSSLTYNWVFRDITEAGPMNSPQDIGDNCVPIRFNDLGPTNDQRISLFRNKNNGQVCARAASPGAEISQTASPPASAVNAINQVSSGPFVNRWQDHWWWHLSLACGPETQGTTTIIRCRWSYGNIEEFLQLSSTIDPPNNTSQPAGSINHQGYGYAGACAGKAGTGALVADFSKMICVRVPYQPTLYNGPDDDLLIDEKRINPLLRATGDSVEFAAAHTFGTRDAGLPFPVCPFGPTYPNNDKNPVGVTGVGYPQNLPQADGGRFCRQGFVGVLYGHDWAPNTGFEGRAVPSRTVGSWAPSPPPTQPTNTNWAQCQSPAGSASGVVFSVGPVDTGAEEFWISPNYQNGPPLTPEVKVGPIPSQVIPIPQTTVTGKNVDCGYQIIFTGQHYYGNGAPFPA